MENENRLYDIRKLEVLRSAIRDNRLSLVHIEKLLSKLEGALEALDCLEENNRIYFSLSNDIMFSFDNWLNVKSVSPNVERILGYTSRELVGRNLQELQILDPKDRKEAYDDALHVIHGGRISTVIYQFKTKEGSSKFGDVINTCVIKGGSVVGLICVGKDVTEHARS